jgi:ppGpp synthetase/RelA/SpoT-type nucleotidyltranferase
MSVIDVFLKQYTKEYDYYYELARKVASICETVLQRNGIHAVVTYRAKRPDSLREKLIKRNEEKSYQTIEDIYQDIADLAGVRIATYFPGDRSEIARLIEAEFIADKAKYFPNGEHSAPFTFNYSKRFTGYDAIHYRVRIKDVRLEDNKKRFSRSQVEVQIASALMHAWAEVEHDLIYKPKVGSLSEEEYRILDELNGLVLSGEIALERLQKAFNQRISTIQHSFNNHYELAALIREKVKMDAPFNSYMGKADILFSFLQKINMDRPKDICRYIELAGRLKQKKTIVRKMIDLILGDHPKFYNSYIQAKYETYGVTAHMSEESLSFIDRDMAKLYEFIELWAKLQMKVMQLYSEIEVKGLSEDEIADTFECRLVKMLQYANVGDELTDEARYLYNLRNNVLFASELPDDEILENGCKHLNRLIKSIDVNCKVCKEKDASENEAAETL